MDEAPKKLEVSEDDTSEQFLFGRNLLKIQKMF